MSTTQRSASSRLISWFLLGFAAVGVTVSLASCAVSDDGAVGDDGDRAADPAPAARSQPDEAPATFPGSTQTIVYECLTTGVWYATRAICQAHCSGVCFACGASCQN